MLVKRLYAVAALAAALVCAGPSEAAEIKIAGLLNDSVVISITGELQMDDPQTFDKLARNLPKAVVAFDSEGGQLFAGLEIGESIRAHGYATAVVDGASCASSCALAWLAGQPRYQSPTGRIGFHAAYVMDKGVATERGAANAVVGAYLTRLGLDYSAVAQLTSAAPDEITWLTPDVARRLDIAVVPLEKRTASGAAPQTAQAADAPPDPLSALWKSQVAAYSEAYSHSPASVRAAAVAEPVDEDLKAFAAGEVTTSCTLRCAFGWGAARDDLERLYQAGEWKALARLVIKKMEVDDLPYFYLAAAAVNLKYYKAADKYAAIAYSYTTKSVYHCSSPLNVCNGHVFPDEEVQIHLLVQAAEKASASGGALSNAQEVSLGHYVSCLMRASADLDDGKSDASSVAAAIAPNCAGEAEGFRGAMEADWPQAAREEFTPTFEHARGGAVAAVVLAVRKGAGVRSAPDGEGSPK